VEGTEEKAPACSGCSSPARTKDENASDTLYIEAFAAPTRSTPCPTRPCTLSRITARSRAAAADGGDCEEVFKAHQDAGMTPTRWA